MRKLIEGIVEFRRKVQKDYREAFGRLATGQSPDTLFIACSDSRVVPNTFASTNPGDLFVIRNVGNLIPACGNRGLSVGEDSEAAAIEYSALALDISDIIVCGHSECAAMRALVANRSTIDMPNVKSWLKHGDTAVERWKSGLTLDASLSDHNQLSQLNVLLQMENIMSYPAIKKRMNEGKLTIHGWWFDIAKADVYAYEDDIKKFSLIDEVGAKRLLKKFKI
ncbi:MAG: carbonic anhydrase [Bdellovibrionales bacterium]